MYYLKTPLRYCLILGLLAASISSINAQQGLTNSGSSASFFQSVDNYFVRDRSAAKIEAEGSPYINEAFENVKFKRFGDRIYSARFNANLGDIEVQMNDKLIALNKNQDFEVTFLQSNKTYKNFTFNDNGKTTKQFFVVVFDNSEYALLKKEYIKFRAESLSQTGYDKGKPAAFIREKDVYYFKVGDDIEELSTRKKKFAAAFPEQTKAIKAYIKNEKLDLEEEGDLIKAFQYVIEIQGAK